MSKTNNIPLSIEVTYVEKHCFFNNGSFTHSNYMVEILVTYSNGTKKKYISAILTFEEYISVKNIITESDRLRFITCDLFNLKFFDYT